MRNPREIVYDRFIKPFEGKKSSNVGVELEFPLINNNGGDIDIPFVASIMDFIEEKGFSCVLFGEGGEKLFMENECGDTLSFDNSYNNFEFWRLRNALIPTMKWCRNILRGKTIALSAGGQIPTTKTSA